MLPFIALLAFGYFVWVVLNALKTREVPGRDGKTYTEAENPAFFKGSIFIASVCALLSLVYFFLVVTGVVS